MSLIDDVRKDPGGSLSVQSGIAPTKRRSGLRDSPIGKGFNERFAPNFTLTVNGIVLPESITRRITSITYEDNEDLFDQMVIKVEGFIKISDTENAFDASTPGTTREIPIPTYLVDEPWFSEGNIIWLRAGYGGELRLIGGGQVVKRTFNYSATPSCTITCYEPLHLMASEQAKQSITYEGMLSSTIVKRVAQKSVYTATKIGALFDITQIKKLPAFSPKAEIQRKGESDWAFLKRLADIRGWHLFSRFEVRSGSGRFVLRYGPDVDSQKVVFRYEFNNKIAYPEDCILSFSPQINLIDQNAEVEIIAFDDTKKKEVRSKQNFQELVTFKEAQNRKLSAGKTDLKASELKNPQSYRVNAFGKSLKLVTKKPFKDEKEIKKYIINLAREQMKTFITGRCVVPGNEALQSRQTIIFAGLGETLSGTETKPAKWYISKCTHKLGGAAGSLVYSNDLEVRKTVTFLPTNDLGTDLTESGSNLGF